MQCINATCNWVSPYGEGYVFATDVCMELKLKEYNNNTIKYNYYSYKYACIDNTVQEQYFNSSACLDTTMIQNRTIEGSKYYECSADSACPYSMFRLYQFEENITNCTNKEEAESRQDLAWVYNQCYYQNWTLMNGTRIAHIASAKMICTDDGIEFIGYTDDNCKEANYTPIIDWGCKVEYVRQEHVTYASYLEDYLGDCVDYGDTDDGKQNITVYIIIGVVVVLVILFIGCSIYIKAAKYTKEPTNDYVEFDVKDERL